MTILRDAAELRICPGCLKRSPHEAAHPDAHKSRACPLHPIHDSDVQDLMERLALLAENDGDAYRERDACAAVDRALSAYLWTERQRIRENFSIARTQLIEDLRKRWSES